MNITLIGMAGVGKSIVGRELAGRLGYTCIDTDDEIQKKTGFSLQQILDDFGDDRFLEIEEKTVLELGECDRCVISPGGSVVYSEKAMEFLKGNSVIVFLNDSFKSIEDRLTDKERRGIVGLRSKGLRALFDERLVLYRRYADIEIEMSEDCGIGAIADDIIRSVFGKQGD